MKGNYTKKFSRMSKAGEISSAALKEVLENVAPGVKLEELDKIAEEIIISLGGQPAFKRVSGYDYTTCINVNQGLVHGIPNAYELKRGDIVSVDLGAFYKGYNSDQCWTVEVETREQSDFLFAGKEALQEALNLALPGNRIGEMSFAIQSVIEEAGFSVSRELVGHGIGKKLHCFPHIPCFGSKNSGKVLKEGMTLAIEVIYQKGEYPITTEEDGWNIETEDGSLAAVFEHTVGITPGEPVVFTDFK